MISERARSANKQPVSRLRLVGESIVLSHDDEISVASDDECDGEVNESDKFWPWSGLQAQSYYHKLSI